MIQHGGHILTDGNQAVALYRCATVSYPFLPAREQEEWLARLSWFAYRVEADFSIYRVNRFYRPEGYTRQARELLDPRTGDPGMWEAYLAGQEPHLEALHAFTPEVYVAVSLTSAVQRSESGIELPALLRRARRFAASDKHDVDALRQREGAIREAAAAVLPIRRCTSDELQWLFARAETRGVAEPPLDQYWRSSAEAIERGKLRLRFAAPPIHEQTDITVVEGRDAVTYQAMLALGALPEDARFPGGAEHLFTPLDRLDFPVDAVAHVKWMANSDARRLARQRVRDADIAYTEATEGGQAAGDYQIEENRVLARDAQDELQDTSHPPLLEVAVSLAVGAGDRQTLRERVAAIRRSYGHIRVERPRGLQALLYDDHLPGTTGRHVQDYDDILTLTQFGALMPVASHDAGSTRGVYLARVMSGGRRPVLTDITAPAKAGRPPAWFVSGGLGGGKTMLAQLLAVQAALRGSRVVTVDPKPDHNLEGVPWLDGRVQVISPSGREEHRGLLDPLVISRPGLREDNANSYYAELLAGPPMEWSTQIRKYVKEEIQTSATPCSLGVIDRLLKSNHAAAKAAGEALEVWSDSGLARLGFGDGTVMTEREAQVTTIRPHDLTLPLATTARANYVDMERLSVATLRLIAAFALRLLGDDRSTHKLFVFDEASVLVNSQEGLRLIDQINLYGRTMNATLVLLAQLAAMVGDLEKLVGTRVILGQETEDEAKRGLQLLGLDPEDRALVQKVLGFRRGRGFIRDIDGQVAEIQIDVVYDELLRALDTSPMAAAVS